MTQKQRIIQILQNALTVPVTSSWHNESKGHPQVTVTLINQTNVSHSDDAPDLTQAHIQIDVWDKKNPWPTAAAAAAALEAEDLYAHRIREQNEPAINRVILEYYII